MNVQRAAKRLLEKLLSESDSDKIQDLLNAVNQTNIPDEYNEQLTGLILQYQETDDVELVARLSDAADTLSQDYDVTPITAVLKRMSVPFGRELVTQEGFDPEAPVSTLNLDGYEIEIHHLATMPEHEQYVAFINGELEETCSAATAEECQAKAAQFVQSGGDRD